MRYAAKRISCFYEDAFDSRAAAGVLFDHSECLRTDGKNTVFQADIAELEQHIAAEFLRKIRR